MLTNIEMQPYEIPKNYTHSDLESEFDDEYET